MPSEMPVAVARSVTVMPSFLRNARTSWPIAISRLFSFGSRSACGSCEKGGLQRRPFVIRHAADIDDWLLLRHAALPPDCKPLNLS
jgi:hypothetical protein